MTFSGGSCETDDSSSPSSTEEKKKDQPPRHQVLRALQEPIAKALSNRTYHLKNGSRLYDLKIESKIAKLMKKLRSQL